MSWNVTRTGTRAEAHETIEADLHVPPTVKSAAHTLLGAFSPDQQMTVSTNGHLELDGTGNATIAVTTVTKPAARSTSETPPPSARAASPPREGERP